MQLTNKQNLNKVIATFESYRDKFPDVFYNRKELANLTGSWFIGPRFENGKILIDALDKAIKGNQHFREMYHPEDPDYVTHIIKSSKEYKEDIEDFEEEFSRFLNALNVSTPFYSYRSLGHMNWEVSIPAIVGYFAAMLYNQNNVALEASPATSVMERSVAVDLCQMLGYKVNLKSHKQINAWGHITCDGSIANIESVWAARNVKYYPIALQIIINSNELLSNARNLTIEFCGIKKSFISLTEWELLNISEDVILELPSEILELCTDVSNDDLNEMLKPYLVQEVGLLSFYQKNIKSTSTPVVIGPSSAHYSWPKACAITGVGSQGFIHVPLDNYARMNMEELDAILQNCLEKQIPVLSVVAVIGTTEEGAVDPLSKIVAIKKKFQNLGLSFHLHADAAWGGYFASMLKGEKIINNSIPGYVPNLSLSSYTVRQFESLQFADSITIDPHKAGYVPYPAGALCYRNSALKNLISFIPSYIDHGSNDPSMGLFGIEGSKPGAAPASVFLSHKVIPPNVNGIGKVLGESLFSAKYFYAKLVAFEHPKFTCIPIVEPEINSKEFVKTCIEGKTNLEIDSNSNAINWLTENGQDTTIVSYFFNFKEKDGKINTDVDLMNKLNNKLYEILSIPPGSDIEDVKSNPLFITSSEFDIDIYGRQFVTNQMQKAGVTGQVKSISFLISTLMCPWITATSEGNYFDYLFELIIQSLEKALTEIKHKYNE